MFRCGKSRTVFRCGAMLTIAQRGDAFYDRVVGIDRGPTIDCVGRNDWSGRMAALQRRLASLSGGMLA